MKISTQQYARSLYEATKDKSEKEIDLAVKSLVGILARNDELKRKEDIVQKFNEIYNQENGIVEAEVTSREKLDEKVYTKVRTWVRTKYGAKEIVLREKTDANLKGGIIVRVGDDLMDGSVASKLNNLRKVLIS